MALSRGNDPLHWRELNAGKPVLTSGLGEKGLRDPFVIRSPKGDRFYLIATDLRMYQNSSGTWDQVQRHGSKSIMVWESTDLVHWTDQRLVKVSPDTAGNTWAPEAYYDGKLGEYVVFWASKLYAGSDPDHTGDTYNKMMYATTKDFRTFSEPKVWNDPGYGVPLNADMTSLDPAKVRKFTPENFREGSFVIKRGARTTSCGPRTTPAARTTTSPTPPAPRRWARGPSGARSSPSAPSTGSRARATTRW